VRNNGDTMLEAIALSSPSGRMSKAARKRANERLYHALFDRFGDLSPKVQQPSERETLLRQADELDALADRGMGPRKHRKEAARLRKLAEA